MMFEHTLPIHWMTWLPSQTVWVLAIVGGWLWAGELSMAAQPPNVILILADDLGAKELGCYGNAEHHTPNLDRMAADGVRFETFFAMPLCTPTRVALMTGQYGFHSGFLGMSNKAFRPPQNTPEASIFNHFTVGDLMKSAGYVTAQVGKWQLAGEVPTLIHDCGFDEYRMWAYEHNLPTGVTHDASKSNENGNPRYWHPSIVENGKHLPTTADQYGPDLFNAFAIDFAKRHKSQPFFIYYTSVLTHGPHVETPDPNHAGKKLESGFKTNLEYFDYLMGQLRNGLKAEGLAENTYILLVGDNGTGGDGKGTVTELGARVPGIFLGPTVKKGLTSMAVADLTDIMPTLAAISGAKLPTDRPFDGHSLLPVLNGAQVKHRDWIYSHLDDGRLLRDDRWLLQIGMHGAGEKFFDCGASRNGIDYTDVSDSKEPQVIAARARFAAILATIPEPKPNGVESNKPKVKGEKKKVKKSKAIE
ncbi:MAG: sulfatase-like hydrolase/transferase [Planctomycetota bacterium]|nr:sulfatase-like hydrolase/transferase [Planctomycetota bacterium]